MHGYLGEMKQKEMLTFFPWWLHLNLWNGKEDFDHTSMWKDRGLYYSSMGVLAFSKESCLTKEEHDNSYVAS